MTKKIGIVADTIFDTGTGSGKYLIYFIEHIAKTSRCTATLILNKNKRNKILPIKADIEVRYIPNIPLIKDFYVRDMDVIILNGISVKSPIYFVKKILTVVHGGYELTSSTHKGYYEKKYYRNTLLKLFSNINITVSDSSKCLLEEGHYSNKFHAVHCGVDHKLFKYTKKDQFSINGNILKRDNFVFHLSRYVPRKNPTQLFDFFEKISKHKELNDIKLVIAGKGWEEQVSIFKTRNPKLSDKVLYLGYIANNDLSLAYSNSLAFLFFSKYEGFGMPLMEAMSCKCITITNNKFSLPEIALGESVFDMELEQTLAIKYLVKVASNKAFRDRARNLNHIKSLNYDWNKTIHKFIDIIEREL